MYCMTPRVSWRMLEAQEVRRAISRARDNEGSSMEAKMAMIAITVRSSIKVNAARRACKEEEFMC